MGKVLAAILGVLVFAIGVYCIVFPVAAYSAIAVFAAISMLIEGIVTVNSWFVLRKTIGSSYVFPLISGILSVVLGIVLLASVWLQLAFNLLIAYLIAFWLLLIGILRIIGGLQRRKIVINDKRWILTVVLGVLLVICAVLAFIEPTIAMVAVGYLIGFSIILAGITTMAVAIA